MYASNDNRVIGPSITHGALNPLHRSPAMKVFS
jgi:hypothetical protein